MRMETLKTWTRVGSLFVVAILVLGLAPQRVQATAYTWTGTASNAWALSTNWTGGTFPNATADQATINVALNNPVQITTSVTLGTTSPALTIGDSADATGLDIASTGTLAMNGLAAGISNNKIITIEGILNANYGAGTSTKHYSISGTGSISLLGGTINGSGTRSFWDLNQPLSGYGTLSNRIYVYSTITANNATPITITGTTFSLQNGASLTTTGIGSFVNSGTITGNGTVSITGPITSTGTITEAAGGVMTINAPTSTLGGTLGAATMGEIDLNVGTIQNFTMAASSGTPFKLIGDSAMTGTITRNNYGVFDLNGHTLHLSGNAVGGVTGGTVLFLIGTGTLDNSSATAVTVSGNMPVASVAGGNVTSTGGGPFYLYGSIIGYGTISAPFGSGPSGGNGPVYCNVPGQTLRILGPVYMASTGSNPANFNLGSGLQTGILELGPGSVLTAPGPTTFTGFVSPGTGTVNLNGTNIVGGTSVIKLNTGTTNVTGDSTLGGPIDCAANLTINSATTLSISGGTATVGFSGGSLINNGTLAIGAGTLKNTLATAYALGGTGSITLAGGSIAATGAGGFTSTDLLSGYGTVSASYTNNAKVVADGSGTDLTLAMQSVAPAAAGAGTGWYAQNHGKLTLPSLTIASPAPTVYYWGCRQDGTQMVNSVSATFGGDFVAGPLTIALLSPDRADVPAGLTSPIGVWQFTADSLAGTMNLSFRYDDAAAGGNESCLQLLENTGSGWVSVPCTVDTTNKLIATGGPVAVPDDTALFAIASTPATPSAVCQPISVSLSGGSVTVAGADIDGGSVAGCGLSLSSFEIARGDVTADCASSGAFGASVIFTVADVGDQTVTLRVTQSGGLQACCATTVTVQGAPQPDGSCCAQDGTCSVTKEVDCTGTWTQDGVCDPNPCSQPTGSCCHADGTCAVTLLADCSGSWTMFGTCEPNTCPQPTGSCCHTDGTCAVTLLADCSGTWTMFGTCDPSPCTQPTGSCCHADGTCAVTLLADCSGNWTMFGTCEPNTCPQPTGSCCHADGTCAVTLLADCSGTWTMFGTCAPNPCEQPPIFDCDGDGEFDLVADTACFVDALLGTQPSGGWSVVDLNHDGFVDGLDIQAYINLIVP